MLWVLGILLAAFAGHVSGQSTPPHCTYEEDYLFSCDYTSMNSTWRPINYGSFSPTPQSMKVQVSGFVPATGDTQVFSTGFSGINKGSFDNNFPSSMEVHCDRKGAMYLNDDSFANMSHVQRLKIKDCTISYISANAFEELEYLDYFGIEMSPLLVMSGYGMYGISVEKLTTDTHTIPQNFGMFEVLYSSMPSNQLPSGFLTHWKNLTAVTVKGCALSEIPDYMFTYNTLLRYIDLSDNTFNVISSNFMADMPSLAELRTYDIAWNCSCSALWFVPYVRSENITMFGDNFCNGESRNVFKFYYDTCVEDDPCEDMTGFAMGKQCVGPFSVVIMIFAFFALGMDIAALVLVILTMRGLKEYGEREHAARGRWNELIEKLVLSKKNNNNNVKPGLTPVDSTKKMAFA